MKTILLFFILFGCASHRPGPSTHPVSLDTLSKDNLTYIQEMITAAVPDYRRCYDDEYFKSGKENNGVVMLKFTIDKDGSTKNSKVEAQVLSPSLTKCLEVVSGRLKFPPVKSGGTIDVKQPMNFNIKK